MDFNWSSLVLPDVSSLEKVLKSKQPTVEVGNVQVTEAACFPLDNLDSTELQLVVVVARVKR